MDRRNFVTLSTSAVGSIAFASPSILAQAPTSSALRSFKLAYAPHFGMFEGLAGPDLIDQLRFASEQGFRGWEDNGMKSRSVDDQQRIADTMQQLGMRMGVISALRGVWQNVNFSGRDETARAAVLDAMRDIIEVAKRVNATYLTVVLGLEDPKFAQGFQFTNCVELLERCCDIVEPHSLVMVLEPLNRRVNHPGVYLSESPHAFQICKAVNRPSCKILFDIYHQQITEGNLINNIDACWDEIAYLQTGDTPGRNEPGTGEINYRNVLAHIAKKKYTGIIGLEHGNSLPGVAGEQAVIDAYRAVDPA